MKFECLKCGKCCRNLVIKIPLGKLGLFLLPSEVHLFPKQYVFPMYGAGLKGRARPRPRRTIVYQYGMKMCLHLTPDNLCSLYSSRPVACREYPLETRMGFFILNGHCTFVASEDKNRGMIKGTLESPELQGANQRILKYLNENVEEISWIFDLESKRWKRVRFVAQVLPEIEVP